VKILLASSLYEPNIVGGAERVAQLLASAFRNLRHEVAVVTTQPSGAAAHSIVDGVSVHYLPVRNIYRPFAGRPAGVLRKILWRTLDSYNFLMKDALGRIIELERPEVLNTHNLTGLSAAIWTEAHARRVPIVHTLHDQYLLCHRSTMFKPPRNCVRQCLDCRLLTAPRKHESRLVSAVIGVSEFILKRHHDCGYFNSQVSTVIYNTAFRKAPRLPTRPAKSCALRFGYLGQIIPTKSVRELVEAFRSVRLDDAELWVAGKCDSTYAQSLEHDSKSDGRVRWLGFVDPEEFFRQIDVLVVPSQWHDTAPLVVLEAFGYGVPVLGAMRGGIPELVPPECGWLFDPGERDSLAGALGACARSAQRFDAMRTACFARAVRMSRAPWAEAYVTAFRDAVSRVSVDSSHPDNR
jgi:glycosyltransferase involved in cell wall biosynthesis